MSQGRGVSTIERGPRSREERNGPPPPAHVESPPARREPAIDILKGLACVAVTAHHLLNKAFAETERAWIEAWGIALPGVIVFLLVAGYLHGGSAHRRPVKSVDYIWSRAKRLLPPFFGLTLIYAVLYTIVVRAGIYPSASDPSPVWYEKWWVNLTCAPGRVGEQLYFLPLVFFFAVAATGFLRLTRGARAWWLGGAIVLGCTSLAFPQFYDTYLPGHPPHWPWSEAAMGLAAYFLGFYAATASRVALGLILTLASALGIVFAFEGQTQPYYLFAAISLFSAVMLLRPRFAPLEWLGRASFTIFLYHTPFFIQPLLYLAAAHLPRAWHVTAAYAVLVFAVTALAALHYKLIRSRFKCLTL